MLEGVLSVSQEVLEVSLGVSGTSSGFSGFLRVSEGLGLGVQGVERAN